MMGLVRDSAIDHRKVTTGLLPKEVQKRQQMIPLRRVSTIVIREKDSTIVHPKVAKSTERWDNEWGVVRVSLLVVA